MSGTDLGHVTQIPPVSLRVNLLKLGGRKALIEALAFEGVNAEFGIPMPNSVCQGRMRCANAELRVHQCRIRVCRCRTVCGNAECGVPMPNLCVRRPFHGLRADAAPISWTAGKMSPWAVKLTEGRPEGTDPPYAPTRSLPDVRY